MAGPKDKFEKFKIKDYRHWSVYIHENQGYLGRCVVWCKRKDAADLTEAGPGEREELFRVLKDLGTAVNRVFAADWFNYAFLGNDKRHLHGHFIPRYASPRKFAGVTFQDDRWGHNYKTDHRFKISAKLLDRIRLEIRAALV